MLTGTWADLVVVDVSGVVASSVRLARLDSVPLAVTRAQLDDRPGDELVLTALRVGRDANSEPPGVAAVGLSLVVAGVDVAARETALGAAAGERIPWPVDGIAVGDFDADGVPDAVISAVEGRKPLLVSGLGRDRPALHELPLALGSILAADLDRWGCDELVGLLSERASRLWIRWNGGAR